MTFAPRRFIVNFVDGTAEFNDDATPPAEEYLSLAEHKAALGDAESLAAAFEEGSAGWEEDCLTAQKKLGDQNNALWETLNRLAASEASRVQLREALKKMTDLPAPNCAGCWITVAEKAIAADQTPNALLGVLNDFLREFSRGNFKHCNESDYDGEVSRGLLASLRAVIGAK